MPNSTQILLSIRAKLLLMVLIVGIVTGGIVTAALIQMKRANTAVSEAISVYGKKVLTASQAKEAIIEASTLQQNLILARSPEEIATLAVQIDSYREQLHSSLEALHPLLLPEEETKMREFRSLWSEWEGYFAEIRRLDLLGDESGESMASLVTGANESYRNLNRALSKLLELEDQLSLDSPRPAVRGKQQEWLQERRATLLVRLKAGTRRLRATEEIQAVAIATGDEQPSEGPFSQVLAEVERDLKLLDPFLGDAYRPAYELAVRNFNTYARTQVLLFDRISKSGSQSAYTIFSRLSKPLVDRCGEILSSIVERSSLTMQQAQKKTEGIFFSSQMVFLAIGVLGIIVAVVTAARTGRGISEQVDTLRSYLRAVQRSGDLSKKVPELASAEFAELGKSFEHMRSSLFKKESELSRANRRLSYSNKRLEEKRIEMEQFVYTVSHDLKSPLVTCKGFVGILKEDLSSDYPDEVGDSLNRIEGACNTMSQIIDDLLELSRLGGKTEPSVSIHCNELLQELEESFAQRLEKYQMVLEVEPNLPRLYAVPSMVRRCFENLISNAIKYGTVEGGGRVRIGGQRNGAEVLFYVSDNGPGIDPQYHDTIFGLFQRLERTKPGTGIGLASVVKIMQLHHGRVWVDSELGQGATFWLAFPDEENAVPHSSGQVTA